MHTDLMLDSLVGLSVGDALGQQFLEHLAQRSSRHETSDDHSVGGAIR